VVVLLIHFSLDVVFLNGAECSDDVLMGVSIHLQFSVASGFVISVRFTVYVKPVGWFGTVHAMKVMVAYGILCHLSFVLKNIRSFMTGKEMKKLRENYEPQNNRISRIRKKLERIH
jgi:hypothetical protein